MAVIFPDIERELVAYLQDALAGHGTGTIRVATKKAQPDETAPDFDVVLTVAYNGQRDYVLREAALVVEVYGLDYGATSELALTVAALIPDVAGETIKNAVLRVGPVRLPDEGPYEKRSLDVLLTVKGSTL
jgi:hypothetical protein